MDMTSPRIEIDLGKIAHNAGKLKELYGSKGISVFGVTKGVCGDPRIADALLKSGLSVIADSRIANIRKMRDAGVQAQFLLLRAPISSQVEDVVRYVDISLNSELSVIEALSASALAQDTTHKIILMVELGDLREGILPADLLDTVGVVIKMDGIELAGIGANLACFGGIRPDDENMGLLSSLAGEVEEKFGLTLEFVSGGNTANYLWFTSTDDVGRINNVRLGESIYQGTESLHRDVIPGQFTDAFTLVAEVIESKIKPSKPHGEVCQAAFGNVPEFEDRGEIRRALLAVGVQDVVISGLTPRRDIDILGASSDHIVVDAKQVDLKVGDEVVFDIDYGAMLRAMTSPYVEKTYVNAP
ncbi:MAG: alanine/ornithine racemase family PLP-dependent enzyme [Candidatus Undinarchaeales archaeon]|jgi:predicted amino acid racemase|nr:alanine/ornithine racemase family PLP-dependent enzyme [Candidatus Undinarchaeales archaeon]